VHRGDVYEGLSAGLGENRGVGDFQVLGIAIKTRYSAGVLAALLHQRNTRSISLSCLALVEV
jgi:hypothetical protein